MSEQSPLWYESEAKRLIQARDVQEIASCLAVRDAACALHVHRYGLLDEPTDEETIAFLEMIVGNFDADETLNSLYSKFWPDGSDGVRGDMLLTNKSKVLLFALTFAQMQAERVEHNAGLEAAQLKVAAQTHMQSPNGEWVPARPLKGPGFWARLISQLFS